MTGHLGKQIAPLVDGQLDHDGRDRALAHIASCASCQWEVAELRHLKARLAGLGGPALPGGAAERLLRMAAPGIAGPPDDPARPRSATVSVRVVIRAAGRGLFVGVAGSLNQPPAAQSPARSPDPAQPVAGRVRAGQPRTRRVALSAGPADRPRRSVGRPVMTTPRSGAGRRLVTRPATGPRGYRSRARRILMNSVAVILFAVAGAALGATAPVTVPEPARPVAIPVVQPSLPAGTRLGGGVVSVANATEVNAVESGSVRLLPVMAVAALPGDRRR
ncbi:MULTISPECIES: zf-HC2 domain-containing protein [unclassified Frankia]|uniref:zf-HC2 domain-containing protein n=1 Tax=unclassified Frankia TaxID=2632575 RepID=UPI001EF624FC|nr:MULTISPECIES: hypothetical protein [unclassified Frankia]